MKNNQKIKLNKIRYQDYISKPEYRDNPKTMYRAGVKSLNVINNEKLTQNLVNHAGLKDAQVAAVLAALPLAVQDYCEAGDAVQIMNLCTFKPVVKAKAVMTEAECDASTIKSKKIRVYPIGDTANVIKNWNFEMTDEVVNGVMEDEDGNAAGGNTGNGGGNQQTGGSNTGNQNQGGNNQGGGSGSQQPTVEDVTYTFKYHDNTEDSRSGLPGEAVDAPQPDEGYEFTPEVPSVFGNSSMTFLEQLIAALKHTVAWYLPNGNPIVWYDLAEGETIPEAII